MHRSVERHREPRSGWVCGHSVSSCSSNMTGSTVRMRSSTTTAGTPRPPSEWPTRASRRFWTSRHVPAETSASSSADAVVTTSGNGHRRPTTLSRSPTPCAAVRADPVGLSSSYGPRRCGGERRPHLDRLACSCRHTRYCRDRSSQPQGERGRRHGRTRDGGRDPRDGETAAGLIRAVLRIAARLSPYRPDRLPAPVGRRRETDRGPASWMRERSARPAGRKECVERGSRDEALAADGGAFATCSWVASGGILLRGSARLQPREMASRAARTVSSPTGRSSLPTPRPPASSQHPALAGWCTWRFGWSPA